jgi:hypothetical protein
MTFIEVQPLDGNQIIVDEFAGIAARAKDPQPAFELIIDSFHKIEARRWAEEGPGWAPLADSTIIRKQYGDSASGYDGGSTTMMVRTWSLYDSLATDSGFSGILRTNDFVEMSTDVPYAHWHQTGTDHMPQRKVVDITEATAILWRRLLQEYFMSGIYAEAEADDIEGAL